MNRIDFSFKCLVEKFVKKFSGKRKLIEWTCQTQSNLIDNTTTHLITVDSGSFSTILSKEILQACVRHVFISSINWVIKSIEESKLVDHFPFEILRVENSPIDCRGLKKCRFDNLPIFPSSISFLLDPTFSFDQVDFQHDELTELIELSGATIHDETFPSKHLIILSNSEKNNENKFSCEQTSFCRPEFLFDSIVRHEIQPVQLYQL